jgi:hypothetical protein
MRPQQQNRRMRGRNNNNNNNNSGNNNRKGPNPLTRNYESNGPDVKIRGSAQQIAEKYSTLARDAMSAGDRVVAENYLQHAEHYNRIIAAAQAQMPIQQVRDNRDEFDDDLDDDRDEMDNQNGNGNGNAETQAPAANGSGPQPVIDGTPAEVALNQDAGSGDGERTRDQRPNGFNNGHNGEDGQRRNRRSRRGGRGRPDFEGGGDGDGEPVQSADAAESRDAAEPKETREATVETPTREVTAPSEPEVTIPNPLPVEPD